MFNNSDANITCLFWVSPTRKLWDLFHAIDNVVDPAEVMRQAGMREVEFLSPGFAQRRTLTVGAR